MATSIDIGSFEAMFRQHYRFLRIISFQLVRDKEIARDIVQDFFLSCWQRRHEIVITTSFQAYAARAVKNLSISHLERHQKQQAENELLKGDDIQADHLEETDAIVKTEKMDLRVLQMVDLLPEERKKIFLSFVIDGLSYAEIAQQYNISINTVKTQMKRAYAFLKSQIADDPPGLVLLAIFFAGASLH